MKKQGKPTINKYIKQDFDGCFKIGMYNERAMIPYEIIKPLTLKDIERISKTLRKEDITKELKSKK